MVAAVTAVFGSVSTLAQAGQPTPVYNIDACTLNGSTTVSWGNFHAKDIQFSWLNGTTQVGFYDLSVKGGKSPVSEPTPSGADNVFVEWIFPGNLAGNVHTTAACS